MSQQQIRVIVADDDEIDRYVARRVLAKQPQIGTVDECSDGVELLSLLQSRSLEESWDPTAPPVLILLDINMPRMSGFDVLRRLGDVPPDISARGAISDVMVEGSVDERPIVDCSCVVVMLTSSVSLRDRREAAGFSLVAGYIEKPLDHAKLSSALADLYPTLMGSNADN